MSKSSHPLNSEKIRRIEANSFLVGGAVRDQLLKREATSNDRDWVIVGLTPEAMLDAGFQQVGNHFPVFLHPSTHEEYALARTEKKEKPGHQGFTVAFGPETTLETDLQRRDLSINAIAQDRNGKLIDPFNGLRDIQNRTIRHVSDAFQEDPLRVLRAARFAAQLHGLGFTIANETMALMHAMAQSGELSVLSAERVWQETAKALLSPFPAIYIRTLHECAALNVWFPEVEALYGVPQRADYHPEIDTGIHIELSLTAASALSKSLPMRYAALAHDLGKGVTPKTELPSHRGHESAGVPLVKALSDRLKAPKECRELALKVCEFHLHIHRALELKPRTLLSIFERCNAFRKPEQFEELLLACHADARGRLGLSSADYPQRDYALAALSASRAITIADAIPDPTHRETMSGEVIRRQIHQARLRAIKRIKESYL